MEESSQLRRYGYIDFEELLKRLPIPLVLIFAEELSSRLEGVFEGVRVREVTKSVIVRDLSIDKLYDFINLLGVGRVRELVLITDLPDFELHVEVDGRLLIRHSFDELSSISQVMEEVDAFEKDGAYVVRLSNIRFTNNCKVYVLPRKRITIKQGLTLYDMT